MKKFFTLFFCGTILACSLSALELRVSTKGSDTSADGTKAKPFASIDAAFAQIKKLGGAEKINEKIDIVVESGDYFFKKDALIIERENSGTPNAPISIRGEGKVNFVGGFRIGAENLSEVKNAELLSRLPAEKSGKLFVLDLKKFGINEYGKLSRVGFGYPKTPVQMEAFFSRGKIFLARYPNEGTLPLGKVVDRGFIKKNADMKEFSADNEPQRGGSFQWDSDRAARWAGTADFFLSGFFNHGWAWHQVQSSVDVKNKTLLIKPLLPYGMRWEKDMLAVNRYYASNIFEELDAPNEYYIDRKNGLFYLMLSDAPSANEFIDFSTLEVPFITMKGVQNVSVNGINFSASRGMGIWLSRCKNIQVADCNFTNLGTCAISTGSPYFPEMPAKYLRFANKNDEQNSTIFSEKNIISNCVFRGIGDDAIRLAGGQNKTLRKSGHIVRNCEFDTNARVNLLSLQIGVDGCGNVVEHCHFYDTPYIVILYSGSENIIRLNSFERCCKEFFDSGVVYTGRRPFDCGNQITNNFFTEIYAKDKSTMMCGVYIDDGSSGNLIKSNIFCRVGTPGNGNPFSSVYFHAGRDNDVLENVFIDCPIVSSQVSWNNKRWEEYWKPARENMATDIDVAIYLKKYPKLADVYNFNTPRINSMVRNRLFRSSMPVRGWFYLNGNNLIDERYPNVPHVPYWSISKVEQYFSGDNYVRAILNLRPGIIKK